MSSVHLLWMRSSAPIVHLKKRHKIRQHKFKIKYRHYAPKVKFSLCKMFENMWQKWGRSLIPIPTFLFPCPSVQGKRREEAKTGQSGKIPKLWRASQEAKRHLQVHACPHSPPFGGRACSNSISLFSVHCLVGRGNESALNEMHFTKKKMGGGSASDMEKRSRSFFRHKSDNDGSCCTNIMAGHFNLPQRLKNQKQ